MEKCKDNKDCKDNIDISEAILTFDTLYTNNHMKILKSLLPYVNNDYQKYLAIYIKWQEFVFTINFFKQYSISLYSPHFIKHKKLDFDEILPLVTPYCNSKEKDFLNHIHQLQNMMQMMDHIQEYMPFIQQLMYSASDHSTPFFDMDSMDGGSILNSLKHMMTEEQQAMFQMFMEK